MRPTELTREDWHRYYSNTYMMLEGENRVVHVRVNNAQFFISDFGSEVTTEVDFRSLDTWWPRPESVNYHGRGVYVGRKSDRGMKKSATKKHYFLASGGVIVSPLALLANFSGNQISGQAAMSMLDSGVLLSAAISKNIVLRSSSSGLTSVVYRGIDSGYIMDDQFTSQHNSFAAERIRTELREEGAIP